MVEIPKRLLAILAIALLTVTLLASCGQETPSGEVSETPPPSSPALPASEPEASTPDDSLEPTPPPVVLAAPSTLTMLSISVGDVFVMKADSTEWIKAEAGMSLEIGDSVKSGQDSKAEITFFDGSTIELEAGTQIEVALLDIAADSGSTTILIKQEIGKTISRVTRLTDPASRYEVETPAGVVAVRGSAVQIYVTEDGTTLTTCLEGNIWAVGEGVELQITEGQQCIIRPGQQPELIYLDEIGPGLWSLSVNGEGIEATVTEEGVVVNFASNAAEEFGVAARTMYNLEGDFDIRVNYELTTWPQGSGVRIGLAVEVSDIPNRMVQVQRVGFGGGSDFPSYPREVYLVVSDQGVLHTTITSTDDLLGTLRIRREGETVGCYYGTSDGWYELYEAEWPTEDAWVGIDTWSHEPNFGGEEVSILTRTVEIGEPVP